MPRDERPSYLIEFVQHGKQVKVVAVDPVSGREVSTIAPSDLPREAMMRLAVRKLEYVLSKNP